MKILVCDKIQDEILDKLREIGEVEYKPKNLIESVKDADVMIVRSATKVNKDVIDSASKLKLVIRAGVGLDNIDLDYCSEKNITVQNTPGASTNAVAEQTIGMIIILLRGIYRGHEELKKGNWIKKELLGSEVRGKTIGIIGFGRIGQLVGKKANALGMKVIAYDPRKKESEFAEFVSLDDLYKMSDIITLHTILIPQTKNMINANSIKKMKNGVYIINLARGGLIDEQDLYDNLKNGKIAGAGLDVYNNEPYSGKLLELNNVFFSPHIGGNTIEAQMKIGEDIVKKVKNMLND